MKYKILILGVTGMLGNTLYQYFGKIDDFEVFGTARSLRNFKKINSSKIIENVDIHNFDVVEGIIRALKPDLVINCVGVIKQLKDSYNPLITIPVNSLFPHKLNNLLNECGGRLLQISTDCVFSGNLGYYNESQKPDATDLYGISKFLGEIHSTNSLTIRTSIIGHEINSSNSLIDWFLSQTNSVKGYTKAIYSGFPTIEIAKIIHNYIIPNKNLFGLYNLSSNPISKFELLTKVSKIYKHEILIQPSDEITIDRSLDSTAFRTTTGYIPPSWDDLIKLMYNFFKTNK